MELLPSSFSFYPKFLEISTGAVHVINPAVQSSGRFRQMYALTD